MKLRAERMFVDARDGKHYVVFISEGLISTMRARFRSPFSVKSNRDIIITFLDQHGMTAEKCWDTEEGSYEPHAIIFPADREDDALLLYLAFA